MTVDALRIVPYAGISGETVSEEPTVDPNGNNATNPMIQRDNDINFSNVIKPALQQHYCANEETILANLADSDSNNDRYPLDNVTGLSVQYSKNGDQVTAQYLYENSYDITNPEQQKKHFFKFSDTDEAEYARLCKELTDPMCEDPRKVEKALKELLDRNLREALDKESGYTIPAYTNKQIRQIRNGIIEDIKAQDRFEHRTVFYDYNKYRKACRELETAQDEVRAKIKNNEIVPGTSEYDDAINLLKTNYSCLSEVEQEYVRRMPEIFCDDHTEERAAAQARVDEATANGVEPNADDLAILEKPDLEFNSDKFKNFCRTLTGDDANLSLAERKNNWNILAMKLLSSGDQDLRDAFGRLQAAENDADIRQEDLETVRGYMRKRLFDNGSDQRRLVKTAGLNADYDYRPLLKIAGIAASVFLSWLGSTAICASETAVAITDVSGTAYDAAGHVIENAIIENVVEKTAGSTVKQFILNPAVTDQIASLSFDATAFAYANACVSGCTEAAVENFASGLIAGATLTSNRDNGLQILQTSQNGDATTLNVTYTGTVNIDQCKEPCEEPPVIEEEPDDDCNDCPCPETKSFHMPMPRYSEKDGKQYIERIEFWEVMNCFRKPDGSKMSWNELKAFIHAYRQANFTDLPENRRQTGYFAAGKDHAICTKFKIGDTVYELDTAALDYLLAHPTKRERKDESGAKKTYGVTKNDQPCR